MQSRAHSKRRQLLSLKEKAEFNGSAEKAIDKCFLFEPTASETATIAFPTQDLLATRCVFCLRGIGI